MLHPFHYTWEKDLTTKFTKGTKKVSEFSFSLSWLNLPNPNS